MAKISSSIKKLLQSGNKIAFPEDVKPMLATLADKPFDEPGWLYEVKWDGYRSIIYLNNGKADMRSRNNKDFNEKFYSVHNALKKWKINAVLDGEIMVLNEAGISNFGNLQNWRSEADGQLILYLFDVLWLEGYNLTNMQLTQRREILKSIIPSIENIRLSETFDAGALEFFEVAKEINLEGIIAKKANSIYLPGNRSKEWLKIKTGKRQEVIIGGYTNNEGSNKPFSALLVGVFEAGKLQYTGKIGTGFSIKLQQGMLEQFKLLETKQCPFNFEPDINKPSRFRPNPPKARATWLQPELVCEVTYAEITSDGVMRHPSFEGMRIDKDAKNVHAETRTSVEAIIDIPVKKGKQKTSATKTITENAALREKLLKGITHGERKSLLNPTEKSQVKTIDGKDIPFNNLQKIYYPKKKVTKRDVINYYYQVAPYMLPYMKDRPQTLIRYPNGIEGKSFYQKDVTGKVPDWVEQFPYSSEAGGNRNFLVCDSGASLLLIASMGGIEMHPWSSRVQKPDHPDWCIIDLDPTDTNTFEQVITAAQVTKQLLDDIYVSAYPKTSGSTGMHIYIPLGAKYTYEQSKEFGRVLVKIIHSQLPGFTSVERLTEKRRGCIYLDFLQNRPQATLAAPYSLRPKPDATVSMPLQWSEVKKGLKMQQFTIFNAMERIKDTGDIFTGVLGTGINMKQALQTLEKKFGKQEMHKSIVGLRK
ncbi:MAG: DNA ligase D [Ginsengibacter sp.]